ncbi:lytic murein transglycosylase [Actinophytocola sp. S1-96]|uniref:Lytic murein transglycosylase n=2 Tax=Actinophytocola gossypii TaxID=2812003 RepID=A0ABT2J6Z8_9PSEU|nr:lytic murein transglycosylase [Actinophytocola gossypii]
MNRSDEPERQGSPPPFPIPELDVPPRSAVPAVAAIAPGGARDATRPTAEAVRSWASALAERTQIPARSLVAYAEAELTIRDTEPGCGLSWSTLAGVGRVESHHGRYGGSDIGADGRLTPPIIGIPLDGSPGVKAIPDTDGGRLDGDAEWDRAVGAMQFLPTTWSRWGARASGDGRSPDPQNIDDAALSAARYLCASGGDLSTAQGWWRAVLTYNESVAYGQNVFSGADAYAKAARELR